MFIVWQLQKQKIQREEVKINCNPDIVNILVNIPLVVFYLFINWTFKQWLGSKIVVYGKKKKNS